MKYIALMIVLGVATTAWAEVDKPDLIASGQQIVTKQKCSICHTIDGKGGKLGKPMNGIAEGKTDEFLKGALLDPKKTIGADTKMPSYKGKITDDEVLAVIEYVKSLKPVEKAKP